MKICIFVVISLALYSVSEAATCPGRPNLIDSLTPFCSEVGDGTTKPACIDAAVSASTKDCTADFCAYYTVTIDSNDVPEADGNVYGFYGCYGETLGVRVCVQSGDHTTQAPAANAGTTVDDGLTTDSGTLPPPAYGYKCASGTVMFTSATCDATAAAVTSDLDVENLDGTTDTAAATIKVVECNDGPTTPAASDTKTCKSCSGTADCTDNTATTTTECTGSCWAYIVQNTMDETDVTVTRGCLSDIDLADSEFTPATCTNEFKDGSCNEANDEEECIRCCTGNACNTFKSDNFLKKSSSNRTIPTVLLMALSLVFAKLF